MRLGQLGDLFVKKITCVLSRELTRERIWERWMSEKGKDLVMDGPWCMRHRKTRGEPRLLCLLAKGTWDSHWDQELRRRRKRWRVEFWICVNRRDLWDTHNERSVIMPTTLLHYLVFPLLGLSVFYLWLPPDRKDCSIPKPPLQGALN